ncbi:hypothetical protein GcC1_131017, partial [Golovinomyces cichoracearum]
MSYIEEKDPTTSKPQIPLKASCHNLDLHIYDSQDGTTTMDDDKITLVEKSMPGTPPKLKSKKYQESIVDLLSLLADSAENSKKRVRIDDMLNDEHHFQSTSGRSGKGKKRRSENSRTTGDKRKTDKIIPLNSFPAVDADNKAFRIPTIVRIKKNGKCQRVRLPQGASQADQGSDINVCSPALASELSAKIRKLSNHGWNTGLQMMTADDNASKLTEFCKLHICTQGVWHAKIFIRSSYIEIGDTSLGEKITKIRGHTFVPSEKHRLVLLPKNPKPARKGKTPVKLQAESDHSEKPNQAQKLHNKTLTSQSTTLKVLNNPIDALRAAENLLSKGIDPELGGPEPHQWEEGLRQKLSKIYKKGRMNEDTPTINPGEKAWDVILQNWNVVSRYFGMRVDV